MSLEDAENFQTEQVDETNDEPVQSESEEDEIEEFEEPIRRVTHNRRVHFVDDHQKNTVLYFRNGPPENQCLVSLRSTVQRYRGVCQRLQIRTLNGVIEQLENMDDGRHSFDDRLDYFSLAREKLDIKQVEALEEIFSRCRFHTIDLEAIQIDENALTEMLSIFQYYESLTHLIFSSNRPLLITHSNHLSKYFQRAHAVDRLDANLIRFDESLLVYLFRATRLSPSLSELHLESCQINGRVLWKLANCIRSSTQLRELYLCDNRISTEDSIAINEIIRNTSRFLQVLDLRSNSLQDNGVSYLASQLSQYDENHHEENSLSKLSLDSNQITAKGAAFLAKALIHNRSLRSINLSNNNIENEGLYHLRDALLANRTINELILRNCHLNDQSAIALAEFIAESTTIHYVDLRGNSFQASGICGMAIAIKSNHSLFKLDFDPIPVSTNYFNISSRTFGNVTTSNNQGVFLSNFRRMANAFSVFNNPLTGNVAGGGTRELLEQKARWINDINAVCQRNILIYEEKVRAENDAHSVPTSNENEIAADSLDEASLDEENLKIDQNVSSPTAISQTDENSQTTKDPITENPGESDTTIAEISESSETKTNEQEIEESKLAESFDENRPDSAETKSEDSSVFLSKPETFFKTDDDDSIGVDEKEKQIEESKVAEPSDQTVSDSTETKTQYIESSDEILSNIDEMNSDEQENCAINDHEDSAADDEEMKSFQHSDSVRIRRGKKRPALNFKIQETNSVDSLSLENDENKEKIDSTK